eukprot:gnl/TRDRNA2_/TRDRNA2_29527_c0_seq1.p1 gnl/TRDRNA2_/TRDRNA2_29527_c0~~gnl/TRDRNA2_/TRDRNA2_29527_c0_seq1.p1  ORF type:complete len:444 (-),score=70.44 gnl/TRDRNA2_/TRDRNA2_29527_c0_seq1:106-1401(-)
MAITRVLKLIEPVRLRAEVVHGFGRGSRQLGFPTANVNIRWDAQNPSTLSDDERTVLHFARQHDTGIYCAFACIEDGPEPGIHKVAMSMGWNPTFSDVRAKTIEPWILHKFSKDFYGCTLRLLVLGYIRPEAKFESVDQLIPEISSDGEFCSAVLDSPKLACYRSDRFLTSVSGTQDGSAVPASAWQTPISSNLGSILSAVPPVQPEHARLLLVRHGESVANEQGVLSGGGSDSQLSDRGVQQAEQLADELLATSACGLAVVGSSPLRRARASADAISRRFPSAARLELEELREMSYGRLEGASIASSRPEMADVAKRWKAGDVAYRVGGSDGEGPADVSRRALSALSKLLEDYPGGTVLLVCHSWVCKAVVASTMPSSSLPELMSVPQRNCAVNIIDFQCGGGAHADLTSRFKVLGVDLVAGAPSGRARQ